MKKRIRKKTDSKQLEVFFSRIAEKADTAMWEYQQERGGGTSSLRYRVYPAQELSFGIIQD